MRGPLLVPVLVVVLVGLVGAFGASPWVPDAPKADTPTVSITTPIEGGGVSAVVNVSGEARDDSAVTAVEVSVVEAGGAPLNWYGVPSEDIVPVGGNFTHVQWTFAWDTRPLKNGDYTVWVRSFDDSIPRIQSSYASRNVTVDNAPPRVYIDAPRSPLSGEVEITGHVDAEYAARVSQVDLVVVDTGDIIPASYDNGTGVWSAAWDTTRVPDGEHVLRARAIYDGSETSFSDDTRVNVDNPLPLWVIVLIIVLVILLVLVIILVVIWVLDRRKIRAIGLDPKDVRKESLPRRLAAFILRWGKVYFPRRFEGATALGSMHTIDMLAILKREGKHSADILGKISYRIVGREASINVFSVNEWAGRRRHPDRLLRHAVRTMKKGGLVRATVEVYDSDRDAREVTFALERARFQRGGEDFRSGTRKRRFIRVLRRGGEHG